MNVSLSMSAGAVQSLAKQRQRPASHLHHKIDTSRIFRSLLSFAYPMSARYAPLPNPRSDRDAQHEMNAAFADSDEEEDDIHDASESQPLNPTPSSPPRGHRSMQSTHIPGTYDFENVDYDYTQPPPGSPPPPSSTALPNSIGNSNGSIPSFNIATLRAGPRRGWFQRSAGAILPTTVAQRLGITQQRRPEGAIGGGTNNDGVFANVTAKPTRPIRIQDGAPSWQISRISYLNICQAMRPISFQRTHKQKRRLPMPRPKLTQCRPTGKPLSMHHSRPTLLEK